MSDQAVLNSQPQVLDSSPSVGRLAAPLDLSPLLIVLTIAFISGVILQRQHVSYSPNDASRWNTVYYLLEHRTYEYLPLTDVAWASRNSAKELTVQHTPVLWTIDMIVVDGKYYSSKPPLLPTVLAGIGWVAQKVSGVTFREDPVVIVRSVLMVAQVLPFAVLLVLLRRHMFRMTDSAFARNFGMAVACFGTLLTPWLITLNNHVIAAATGMIALDAAIRIWYEGRREWYWFAVAGFFAAFTASIELPAGLLAVILFAALVRKDAVKTLTIGLIPALIPAAAALYTNHIVTDRLMPAYESWNKPGGFYDYPGSYWNDRQGVDALDEHKAVYIAHMLIGHDGFFSLTPVLLVALAGLILELQRRGDRMLLAVTTLAMTGVLIVVYTVKTNNYGGGCQGFRWLFWVLPMWLLFLPAGVEWFARKAAGRYTLYCFLAVSVFSVGYAMSNPWTTNWMRLLLRNAGVIDY